MAKKQPEVTAATRAKLVAAFWRLYAERPIEKVRVADVTGLAGYNRSTFYEYFADVPQILESEEQALVELVERHAKDTDISDPAQVLAAISEIYEANGDKIALLLGERGDPGFAACSRTPSSRPSASCGARRATNGRASYSSSASAGSSLRSRNGGRTRTACRRRTSPR